MSDEAPAGTLGWILKQQQDDHTLWDKFRMPWELYELVLPEPTDYTQQPTHNED